MQNIKARTLPIASIALILIVLLTVVAYTFSTGYAVKPAAPVLLDPKTIPKYVNQLIVPPVYVPDSSSPDRYTITMATSRQKILPTGTPLTLGVDGKTNVWGYQGNAIVRGATLGIPAGTSLPNFINSPSSTFEVVRGTPTIVKWVNNIGGAQPFAVDPTLYWANPTGLFPPADSMSPATYGGTYPLFPPGFTSPTSAQTPVALVPHLHGAEVLSDYDGGPEHWWTSTGVKGPNYRTFEATDPNAAVYYYPNAQEANTLWYHDHALGLTRLNVMSGLAGYYLLRDPLNTADQYFTTTFPYGVSEIPIAIQDRIFDVNGELVFPSAGINPLTHPYWVPEFFGNTIMVNGLVWPNLDVTPGWYRFRLLDGSNARFYTLSFDNKMPFTVIGEDGGYLKAPVIVKESKIAPGERADVLVQFTPAMVGSKIILTNTAKAPFPNGAAADPQTTGQIMQFTVKTNPPAPAPPIVTQGATTFAMPAVLNPTLTAAFPTLPAATVTRYITLVEVMGAAGPVMVTINGQYYNGVATETPTNGATEEWVIINLTADTHPIHTHLATFQLVSRQTFQSAKYLKDWLALNAAGGLPPFTPRTYEPTPLPPLAYLQQKPVLPTPTEMGWKDTLQMNPGEVTTIRIRFTQQDGIAFPFDPTKSDPSGTTPTAAAAGYVWHCHIIDHEDNEMMRPLMIKAPPPI